VRISSRRTFVKQAGMTGGVRNYFVEMDLPLLGAPLREARHRPCHF
jgi:hypothetical protein